MGTFRGWPSIGGRGGGSEINNFLEQGVFIF